MLDQTMLRIKRNIKLCLSEIEEMLETSDSLLFNNNIVILVDRQLYHQVEDCHKQLAEVGADLYKIYANIDEEYTWNVLELTILGHDLIEKMNDMIQIIEDKWTESDIDVNKYLFAEAALDRLDNEEVILDIDDLEYVVDHPKHYWICLYVVHEKEHEICHYACFKTKREALVFAMQMQNCGKDCIFNRFEIKI